MLRLLLRPVNHCRVFQELVCLPLFLSLWSSFHLPTNLLGDWLIGLNSFDPLIEILDSVQDIDQICVFLEVHGPSD